MPTYTDYTKILNSINFTGGAGKTQLTPIANDDRTIVQTQNGIAQLYYQILMNISDITAHNYHLPYEQNNLPNGTPALTTTQAQIVQNILHSSLTDILPA